MALFILDDELNELNNRKKPVIKDFRKEKDYIVYEIEVNVGLYTWTVGKRYKDFSEFDKERFKNLKQSFLPQKRLIGNQDIDFVKKRRQDLQRYLQIVFELECVMQKQKSAFTVQRPFARFLDFHKYEVRGICERLAETLSANCDQIISSGEYYTFDTLALHALTERLKLAEPTGDPEKPQYDIGHLLDFVNRLTSLKIKGSRSFYGTSNIIPNNLELSLAMFKNVQSLWISDCDTSLISDLVHCRTSVSHLTVHRSLSSVSDILLDKGNIISNYALCGDSQKWQSMRTVDFSFNKISAIDESVILLHRVETLNLAANRLTDINHLHHLNRLTELNLSHNHIENIGVWHRKLGNVKRLILTANKLKSVEGLSRLFSVEYLDLRNNQLVLTSDTRPLGDLPIVKEVFLSGNPLEASVEYRSRVLEVFGDRASEVLLDGQAATQRELDTVGVRLAIRRGKLERERRLREARDQISRALEPSSPPDYRKQHRSASNSDDD